METCKLRIKIGPYEMEAEGPRDFVENHYGSFSERIPGSASSLSTIPSSEPPARGLPNADEPERRRDSSLTAIFHQDDSGKVSLTAKPSGESPELDAILLLLLGHKEMRSADLVSAGELAAGMRQSGFPVDRVDRIASRGEGQGLLQKTGSGNATRYRITNQGTGRARSLAEELLRQVA